jgi:hypothetical protein
LFLSYIEISVINLAVALLYGDFEGVDNLDLTAILSAKKSTEHCIMMRPESSLIKMNMHQKGGFGRSGVYGELDVQRCSGSEGGDWERSKIRDMPTRISHSIPTGRAIDWKECSEVVQQIARLIPS